MILFYCKKKKSIYNQTCNSCVLALFVSCSHHQRINYVHCYNTCMLYKNSFSTWVPLYGTCQCGCCEWYRGPQDISESESRLVVSNFLRPHGLYSPWNSPGQNTGVGSLYQLSHKGSPRILEWVAYTFSSGSSWPRNQTRVSCTAGGFFTNSAIREAPVQERQGLKIKAQESLAAQRLELWAFTAEGAGLIPGWGTKDPPNLVARPKKEKKIKAHHSPSCYISLLLGSQYL